MKSGTFGKKVLDNYTKQKIEKLDKVLNVAVSRLNNEMCNEATKMYDSFIESFYDYKTTSYIRHWEGRPGTRHGESLLMGKNFVADNKHGHNQTLTIDFNSNEMESYGVKYQHHSASEVLDLVLGGIRFQLDGGSQQMEWAATYNGDYFSHSGNVYTAFSYFEKHFNSIALDVFYSFWGEYIGQLRLY